MKDQITPGEKAILGALTNILNELINIRRLAELNSFSGAPLCTDAKS
jgi:hypothetical protein